LARLPNDVSHSTHTHAASRGESQGGPSLAAAEPRFEEGGGVGLRAGGAEIRAEGVIRSSLCNGAAPRGNKASYWNIPQVAFIYTAFCISVLQNTPHRHDELTNR